MMTTIKITVSGVKEFEEALNEVLQALKKLENIELKMGTQTEQSK